MPALLILVALSAYQPSDGPPAGLGGDLTKKKLAVDRDVPASFEDSVQLMIAEKRREQIAQLEKLLELTKGDERAPLLFRLGDLYWEESRSYPDDKATFGRQAVDAWTELVQRHPNFERMDEALYFMGKVLSDLDDERRALIAFKRLVEKYPKSKFVPNAWLAFGDYYFEHKKLDKALEAYRKVDGPLSAYKQGWCSFNLADYERAMESFRTVALSPRLDPKSADLSREARADFVRAFSRSTHSVKDAHELFNVLATDAEQLRTMNKQLASLYYDAGRAPEAAIVFKGLIDEKPSAPEAVGFQIHIIEVMLAFGDKRMTLQQIHRLRQLGKPGDDGERLLSGIAVNWHNEARKTRDDQTPKQAAEVYAEYLALFPDHARAYDLRFFYAELLNDMLRQFDLAAPQYALVAKQPGKWRELAAYDAVLAYEQLPDKRALVAACDAYGSGAHQVEIAYKAARVQYGLSDQLRDAAQRFHRIAVTWPDYKFDKDTWACGVSAHLSLDALNQLQDYEQMMGWGREYLKTCHDPKLPDELRPITDGIAIKLCKTGDCFEAIGTDAALFKAAELFEKEKRFDKAIAARKKLPASSKFAPRNTWLLASDYEAIADFAHAAETYEAYPKDGPDAHDALLNAGSLRADLGQHDRAIEARRQLLIRWPKDPDAEKLMRSLAEQHQQAGHAAEAILVLEAIAKAYPKTAIETYGRIAQLQEPAQARKTYAKLAALYDGRSSAPEVLDAVARARLVGAEADFEAYRKLKLRWSRLSNPGELKTTLAAKTKALESLTRLYTDVVRLKSADPAICALYKLGLAYDHLADTLEHVPVPRDAPPAVREAIGQQLPPDAMRARAKEAFAAAVAKSDELQVFNACSKAARGPVLEETPAMKVNQPPRDRGLDLLLNVVP